MQQRKRGSDNMRNIIFIAPPAAGKGTVSDYLVKHYHYNHLSTGDLLRSEIASGSEFGKEINEIISKGHLVSDDVIIKLVYEKLKTFRLDEPFILDGFPRTLIQAKKLDEMLVTLGITNMMAVYLNVDYDFALKKTLGRIVCPTCKRSYNLYFEAVKPQVENLCDDCKVELEKRSDDNAQSFQVRFESYMKDANVILDFYRSKKMLHEVVVTTDVDKMIQDVVKEAKND